MSTAPEPGIVLPRPRVTETVALGLIGLGTVGTGVYKVLSRRAEVAFNRIAVRDTRKARAVDGLSAGLLTDDPFAVVRDPAVQVVVEVMGGVDPARALVAEALSSGKHVVTANKELIAKHGAELFALARTHGVRLLFEGAVAGGIPIIMPLKLSLAANEILEIAGIINGTTNYILTKMSDEGWDYRQALEEAKAKGFAEADPTSDVEGFDTAYKIAILASIAFRQRIEMQDIYCQGISTLTATDIQNARELGYAIKLIGLCRRAEGDRLDVRVHPMLVPLAHPLASIKNENNAVFIRGDAVGDVMFYGRGAGELPTASAVCGDILAIAHDLQKGNDPIPSMELDFVGQTAVVPVTETRNRYYIRLNTYDLPGVIGNLGKACGEFGVSLLSVLQKGANPDGTASIVLITHEVLEKQMRDALDRIVHQETTQDLACLLRVL